MERIKFCTAVACFFDCAVANWFSVSHLNFQTNEMLKSSSFWIKTWKYKRVYVHLLLVVVLASGFFLQPFLFSETVVWLSVEVIVAERNFTPVLKK